MKEKDDHSWNVFINCPFDEHYEEIFHAIIFAIIDCGYTARSAQESCDGSEVRIQKIISLIKTCQLGIHDISRVELSTGKSLPRFNMPLELGLFLGSKFYGNKQNKKKSCLILDSEQYRYQIFLSDIAGQDIRAHENSPEMVIKHVRDWLSSHNKHLSYPGGKEMYARYQLFRRDLPEICNELKQSPSDLTFTDYCRAIYEWLNLNGNKLH